MAIGRFITLEGGEGSGKTTQARILAERLEATGYQAVLTREPGGSAKAEGVRELLLSGKVKQAGPFAEAILFSVARDDHLEQTIRPALADGKWVVCDRFADSTRAYQGVSGLRPSLINALERLIVGRTRPDLTLVLDLAADEGLRRAASRPPEDAPVSNGDRFEAMDLDFHERLRKTFLEIADRNARRCVIVDAHPPASTVAESIWELVVDRLHP